MSSHEKHMRRALRIIIGGLLGLVAYCLFIAAKELPHLIFRGYYDWEGVVYQWVLPLGPITLVMQSSWQSLPLWVNLETLLGDALIVLGILLGARKKTRSKAQTETSSEPPVSGAS